MARVGGGGRGGYWLYWSASSLSMRGSCIVPLAAYLKVVSGPSAAEDR